MGREVQEAIRRLQLRVANPRQVAGGILSELR